MGETIEYLWGGFLFACIVTAIIAGLIVFIGNVLCGQVWSFVIIARWVFGIIVATEVISALGKGLS
jgi:hypothetical protein